MTTRRERAAAVVATVLIVGSFVYPVLEKADELATDSSATQAFCGERDDDTWILVACVAAASNNTCNDAPPTPPAQASSESTAPSSSTASTPPAPTPSPSPGKPASPRIMRHIARSKGPVRDGYAF